MIKELRAIKEKIHNQNYYKQIEKLPYKIAKSFDEDIYDYKLKEKNEVMINEKTGFSIEYQLNKVFNLKLAAKKLNNLVIYPDEVFSFWYSLKDAQKKEKYKDGLCIIKGEMAFVSGGGLCQLSNLLFYLFLNGPFEIIERHGHQTREFDDPNASIRGIDATVAEGYLDLKVKNISNQPIQIKIVFTDSEIIGGLYAREEIKEKYSIINKNLTYNTINGERFETVDIFQEIISDKNLEEKKLYTNVVKLLYEAES